MTPSVEDCTRAIREHTLGLAEAATGHLDRPVEHCPGWSVADLVWHLTGVHRFWEHVAAERPSEPPSLPEVERPTDDELVDGMLAAMERLVTTLGAADQDAPCWTWGERQDVGFVTRHQVQEAAVHHWDALNAVGRADAWAMDEWLAMDACEEFLTCSVANRKWPMPEAEPLGGTLWFRLVDGPSGRTLLVTDGDVRGTLALSVHDGPAPDVDGPSYGWRVGPADLLLWLYDRVPAPGGADGDDPAIATRFRALCSTD